MTARAVCPYCENPVFTSRQSHRTQHVKKDGVWVTIVWHTECDPFDVKTTVTRRP